MTPQESQALQTLLSQLVQIRGIPKDADADRMIAAAVAQQPDAAYLLVQRSLLLEQALEAAKQQISALQRPAATPASAQGGSFLDANAWGRTARSPAAPETSVSGAPLSSGGSRLNQNSPAFGARGAQRSGGFLGGGAGSMLGTLAATAAGVAGGAFLFQGIGNLLNDKAEPNTSPAEPLADSGSGSEAAPLASSEQESAAQETAAADSFDAPVDDLAADSSFDDGGFDQA